MAEIRGNNIEFLKELQGRDTVLTEIQGFGPQPEGYDMRIENRVAGIAVHQIASNPMSKLVLWAVRNTVCPEAYIDIRVEPGKETNWRIGYAFSEIEKQ